MPSLAETLRTRTWPAHRQVEGTPFVRMLLGGAIRRDDYCRLLRSLHEVYAALEDALVRHADHPVVAAVQDPALFRRPALADDLLVLHGPGWSQGLAAQPAALAMAQRLELLSTHEPDRLTAYAYVRYLGDLSGGQVLRRTVAAALALDADGSGTRFYAFDDATPVAERARRLRTGLDRVGGDPARHAAIVDEALRCFELHGQLFNELHAASGAPALASAEKSRMRP